MKLITTIFIITSTLVLATKSSEFHSNEIQTEQLSALKRAVFAGYQNGIKPDGLVKVKGGWSISELSLCPDKEVKLIKIVTILHMDCDRELRSRS